MSYEQSPWFQTAKTLWIYARNTSEEYAKRSITNALAEAYTAGTEATQESLRARVVQLEEGLRFYGAKDSWLKRFGIINGRPIDDDRGMRARAALNGREEKGKGV